MEICFWHTWNTTTAQRICSLKSTRPIFKSFYSKTSYVAYNAAWGLCVVMPGRTRAPKPGAGLAWWVPEAQSGGGEQHQHWLVIAPSRLLGHGLPSELLCFLCSVNKAIWFIRAHGGDLSQGKQPLFYPLHFPTGCHGFLFVSLHALTLDTRHCLGTLVPAFLPLQILSLGCMEDVDSASFYSPNC